MINIALAGNPNSGKTTLFNALTGSNQYIGNWPGVTVEKKQGFIKGNKELRVTDLPGIYSLSPYTLEEEVTRKFLLEDTPDVILNIVDGSNIERNLYLSTQLMEIGIPYVMAINMMDIVEKRNDHLDVEALSQKLHCPIVQISALKKKGMQEVIEASIQCAKTKKYASKTVFSKNVEDCLQQIQSRLEPSIVEQQKRFYAVKVFERDEKIKTALVGDAQVEADIVKVEAENDDDSESIITNERYLYIQSVLENCFKKHNKDSLTVSDRIDRIATNRWAALPIFACIMFIVYYVSVTTIGGWSTNWVNDNLFDAGFKLFGVAIPSIPALIGDGLNFLHVAGWLNDLILDGIVAGVGAVLGFVPQMLVLFFFLSILEGCGYMARVAFIMDRIFRKFGLSGKSFIPMLIGSGCGVPAIMSSRTIENDRDRRMTIMTTTFIPCTAKLPIIALISGALFHGAAWVAPSAYFVGIAAIIVSGIILKKTRIFAGDPAPFVMELPSYHIPTWQNVLRSMWQRAWSFIKKAGTVILLSTIVVWFTSNYGFVDGHFGAVKDLSSNSILSGIGRVLAFIFTPLGFGNWQSAVAAVTGIVAKENVVGTFGILFGFGSVADNGVQIWSQLAATFTVVSAYAFLVFNLLCAPCFAAIGAIRREMNSGKWTWIAIGYQTIFAYIISFIVFQLGSLIFMGSFSISTIIAFVALIVVIYFLVRPQPKHDLKNKKMNVRSVNA